MSSYYRLSRCQDAYCRRCNGAAQFGVHDQANPGVVAFFCGDCLPEELQRIEARKRLKDQLVVVV